MLYRNSHPGFKYGLMRTARHTKYIRTVAGLVLLSSVLAATGLMQNPTPVDGVTASGPEQITASQIQTNTGPRIQFNETVHNFGRVIAGATQSCVFVFTNVGDATLEVSDVRLSCGCTTAGEWTKLVQPGCTGAIPVQFHASLYPGQFIKTAAVVCNDPQQPTVLLQLKGEVWRPLMVEPQAGVVYATTETLGTASTTVRITNNEPTEVAIQSVAAAGRGFSCILQTNIPGWFYELRVQSDPGLAVGAYQGQIQITTTSTNAPTLQIPVMVVVRPVISVSPPSISLPASKLSEPLVFVVSVYNHGTNNMQITGSEIGVSGASAEIRDLDPGRAFRITVKFEPGFELPAGSQATLRLITTHPDHRELTIPIVPIQARTPSPIPAQQIHPLPPPHARTAPGQ